MAAHVIHIKMMVKAVLLGMCLQQFQVSAFLWPRPSRAQRTGTPRESLRPDMDTTELIKSRGYPCENHYVTTKDGYILNLQRIPHGRHNKESRDQRPVALLQHGLLGSSTTFVVNGANQSLAFLLADAGVDVWLGNNRGNTYSKRHRRLKPQNKKFWDFSWDEMAKYDLPAEINYIIQKTKVDKIYYVGFGQGATIGLAQFSEDHELGKKIKHFIGLAPVSRVTHTTSALRLLVPFADDMRVFSGLFGTNAVSNLPNMLSPMAEGVCPGWIRELCTNLHFLMGGIDEILIDESRMDFYKAILPSSTSAKTLMHWAQNVRDKEFQRFDYGVQENMKKYKQKSPPLYDPVKLRLPVTIFRGGVDFLADPTDVKWLSQRLLVTKDVHVPWYSHFSFIIDLYVHNQVYAPLIEVIKGSPPVQYFPPGKK